MKLRNKKTGEIKDALEILDMKQEDGVLYKYYSMSELNKDWEDYEEPKEYYYIDEHGNVCCKQLALVVNTATKKEIGNYFETKEEAEKAVEKLKAWKRLKDNGFEITGWKFTPDMKHTKGNFVTIKAEIPYIVKNQADLDLLFGGEE